MTRRPDGRPETPADTRFFELRSSGYRGWIDQDGYPVENVDQWIAGVVRQERDRTKGE